MGRRGCDNTGQGRRQGEELGRRWRIESGGGKVQENTGQGRSRRRSGGQEREIEEREREPRAKASGGLFSSSTLKPGCGFSAYYVYHTLLYADFHA